MSEKNNINYTRQKIKIKTDKRELTFFNYQIARAYSLLNNDINTEYVKRELYSLIKKIGLKVTNPNKNNLKQFSFNFYEAIALKYLSEQVITENHYFDIVFWKIDSQLIIIK
jgi:hypothetical protein